MFCESDTDYFWIFREFLTYYKGILLIELLPEVLVLVVCPDVEWACDFYSSISSKCIFSLSSSCYLLISLLNSSPVWEFKDSIKEFLSYPDIYFRLKIGWTFYLLCFFLSSFSSLQSSSVSKSFILRHIISFFMVLYIISFVSVWGIGDNPFFFFPTCRTGLRTFYWSSPPIAFCK